MEQGHSGEDIEAETCPGHGHNETTYITKMSHCLSAHERQDDVVVLLPLVTVYSGHLCRRGCGHSAMGMGGGGGALYLLWQAKDWVSSTTLVQHISDEVLLSIVSGQYGNLVGRVALKPHVHENGHSIFCLTKILREGEGGRE